MITRGKLAYKRDLYRYLAATYLRFLTTGKCLDYPFVLHIQTQSFCNGQCSTCPYPVVSKNLEQGTMEWQLFDKLANESVPASLLTRVRFELQNEPLLDSRIFNWIKHFKSLNPKKRCLLVTNGELLNKYSLQEIMQANLHHLYISLNAYSKQMYERINSGINHTKVIENVHTLISSKDIRPIVVPSFVFTEQNALEVYEAVDYWEKQGLNTRVLDIDNRGGSLANYGWLKPKIKYQDNDILSSAWQRLIHVAGSIVGCRMPFYQMGVLFNGDVIICSRDWRRATIVGNLKNSTLRQIWNSEKMNEIRRLIWKKQYNRIAACEGCSYIE